MTRKSACQRAACIQTSRIGRASQSVRGKWAPMQMICIFSCETIVPTLPMPFGTEAWKKLRPHVLSAVIEIGIYLRYWLMVLVAHVVRLVMSAGGIDLWLVGLVGWMENIVFIASFASFFWRLLVRLYNETTRGTL